MLGKLYQCLSFFFTVSHLDQDLILTFDYFLLFFQEWHLKCNHYAVIAGYNGDCAQMKEFFNQGIFKGYSLATKWLSLFHKY